MAFKLCHCPRFLDRTRAGILVGLVLLNVTIGIQFYYGNLSTYTDSYFIDRVGLDNHPAGSLWFISLYVSACIITIILSEYVVRRIGIRATLAISCLFFNLAIFATFLAIQISFWTMNIVLGVLGGSAFGFLEGLSVLYAAAWFPDNVGVATSVALGAIGGGGLILNPMITFFINPNNAEPDLEGGTSVYFSDPVILSRVPYLFLLLGGVSTVAHITAIILLKPPPGKSAPQKAESSISLASSNSECVAPVTASETTHILSCGLDWENTMSVERQQKAQELEQKSVYQETGLTPLEMMKTGIFYKLAFALMIQLLCLNVEVNAYKQFGLLTIPDDHFLSLVGTLTNVTICVFRMVWGVLVDTIGPKQSIVVNASLHSIFCAFWFFTPLVNKWFFLFWTLAIQAIQGAVFVAYPVIILKYFGSAHYVSNYGCVMSCDVLINISTTPLLDAIIANFGYFWLFFSLAVGSALTFATVLSLPCGNNRDHGK